MCLADQPALTPGLIQSLVARHRATRALIVAPVYQGRRGNPVLFDQGLFVELGSVEGDQGGRELIHRYKEDLELVETEDPGSTFDVDTWQDYEALRSGKMVR
jgi:molybdenum cofactor cytidylyltransferase